MHSEIIRSTLYLIETPFDAFANRADPNQVALLLSEMSLSRSQNMVIIAKYGSGIITIISLHLWSVD